MKAGKELLGTLRNIASCKKAIGSSGVLRKRFFEHETFQTLIELVRKDLHQAFVLVLGCFG